MTFSDPSHYEYYVALHYFVNCNIRSKKVLENFTKLKKGKKNSSVENVCTMWSVVLRNYVKPVIEKKNIRSFFFLWF